MVQTYMKQLIDLQMESSASEPKTTTALEKIKECVKKLYCKKAKGDVLQKMEDEVEAEFGKVPSSKENEEEE